MKNIGRYVLSLLLINGIAVSPSLAETLVSPTVVPPAESAPISGVPLSNPPYDVTTPAWTLESAHNEAFKQLNLSLDTATFIRKDPEFDNSLNCRLSLTTRDGDKILHFFSNGDYCYYHEGSTLTMCYRSDGQLFKINQSNFPKGQAIFPMRNAEYTYPQGFLERVDFFPSAKESFIFAGNGTLKAHWVGNTAYDQTGNIITTRQTALPK